MRTHGTQGSVRRSASSMASSSHTCLRRMDRGEADVVDAASTGPFGPRVETDQTYPAAGLAIRLAILTVIPPRMTVKRGPPCAGRSDLLRPPRDSGYPSPVRTQRGRCVRYSVVVAGASEDGQMLAVGKFVQFPLCDVVRGEAQEVRQDRRVPKNVAEFGRLCRHGRVARGRCSFREPVLDLLGDFARLTNQTEDQVHVLVWGIRLAGLRIAAR